MPKHKLALKEAPARPIDSVKEQIEFQREQIETLLKTCATQTRQIESLKYRVTILEPIIVTTEEKKEAGWFWQ